MLSARNAKNLAAKVTLYESLLIDLLPSLDPARQQVVRNTIAEVCLEIKIDDKPFCFLIDSTDSSSRTILCTRPTLRYLEKELCPEKM